MNDKRNIYGLLLLLPALLFFSCSQEELSGVAGGADGSGIIFRATLPATGTRSTDTAVADDLDDGFYVSAVCPEDDASAGNALDAYFTELLATPLEEMDGCFGILEPRPDQSAELCVWPTIRHRKDGRLKFFAFYPSREVLRQSAGDVSGSGHFELKNNSTKSGTTVLYDYRMAKFRVNKDIARHIDFVAATAEGSKKQNEDSGVNLEFEHQLSRVALKAWGVPNGHTVEIVGVRIGRAIVESDFNFAGKPATTAGANTVSGSWVANTQVKDCVEYIFREGDGIREGDTVISIDGSNYKTADTAVSIMGNGGWAMVIPGTLDKWNHTKDAKNGNQGLYFSVLLRVKDRNDLLLYPYTEGADMNSGISTDRMNVIYFSIHKNTGKVMKRLYKDKNGAGYFTDSDFKNVYDVPATEEVRNYGWAAAPFGTTWRAGYEYTYTLDYSKGVGVEDPDDPFSGKPIISPIEVTGTTTPWHKVKDYDEEELNLEIQK